MTPERYVWAAIGGSVIGPAHGRAGTRGEDALWQTNLPGGPVAAVADGHGSARCFRADIGASLAVHAAAETLSLFLAEQISARNGMHIEPGAARDIGRRVVEGWQSLVTQHRSDHPYGAFSGEDASFDEEGFTPYGTTLLAAAANGQSVVIAQIGDGEAMVVDHDGRGRRAFVRDELLVADQTTSLALADAASHLHVALLDAEAERISLVLLATDGYSNAFADDAAWMLVGSDLWRWTIRPGLGWIEREMPTWLEQAASVTGDDASLALLVRLPAGGEPAPLVAYADPPPPPGEG